MNPIAVGQLAPEFQLQGPGGQWVSLSDYRDNHNVVLVFYPLAFSRVCSHELPEVQKHINEFSDLDTVVFGISVDSHYANTAFAKSLKLDFSLLSDFKRLAMTAYGVLRPEKGYSGRATFLVGKDGRIAYVEVAEDASDLTQVPSPDRVLEAIRAMAH